MQIFAIFPCVRSKIKVLMCFFRSDHYLGKFTLGSLIRRITARECGERCDTEDRCMGFNYYRTSQGK